MSRWVSLNQAFENAASNSCGFFSQRSRALIRVAVRVVRSCSSHAVILSAHWGWAFLLTIVAQIIANAGLIACFVGVLATMPLYGLMLAAAYRRLFAETTATA